jgi:methyl halide transferase
MTALVKPGGFLITLVYPLDPPTDLGPPFFVRPEHYVQSLGPGWEKVLDEVPKISSETHIGRERMVVWRRNQDGELAQ